ncbi:tRNA lysidine(34) synthetase TilS [Jutongia sp.]
MKLESYHEMKAFCDKNKLLQPGDRVLVAFSGGADSVYLTIALQELSKEWDFALELLHVNHQIRGEEAERDEEFCRTFAEQQGLKLHVCSGDVPKMGQEQKCSLEEAARKYRYQCIEELVEREGFDRVAVAHHQDDQAETVLFQMLRGSGVRGMGGMRPQHGIYIRPLLFLRHRDIVRELGQCGQSWCEDSTNQEEDCSRNKIRLTILPMLEEHINSSASAHLARTAQQMQEVQSFLEEELTKRLPEIMVEMPGQDVKEDGQLTARIEAIQKLPGALQMEWAHWMITKAAGRSRDISMRHMEALLELAQGETGKRLDLPYGLCAGRDYDCLWIRHKDQNADVAANTGEESAGARTPCWKKDQTEPVNIVLTGMDGVSRTFFLRRENFLTAFEHNERKIPKNNCTKWFDYAKICGMLEFRHPAEGDFLWLDVQGTLRKPLNRLLIDRHIPRDKRKQIWILAEGSHVLWVPALDRVSAGYYISDRTEEILCINMITESEKKDERNSTCNVLPGAGGEQN